MRGECLGRIGLARRGLPGPSSRMRPCCCRREWGSGERETLRRIENRAGQTLIEVNGIQFVLACAAYAGLVVLSAGMWHDAVLRPLILIQGLSLFVVALSVDWVFNGFEQMRVPALLNLLNYALQVAGYVLWVHTPEHLIRFALIGLVCSFAHNPARICRAAGAMRLKFDLPTRKEVRSTLRQSLPLGATMALALALRHANTLGVQHFCAPPCWAAFSPLSAFLN